MGATPRSDSDADAVVIGAGHNGLVAAAYLARAGLRVTVLERRDVVGGAAVTEELAPGFRASTASYALSLLRPDVYADLSLASHGLSFVAKDPQMFVPLADGGHFFVWRDPKRTQDELSRISPADASAHGDWCAFWDEAVRRLRPLVDTTDPPPLGEVEAIVGPDIWRWALAGSAADVVERFFSHPGVQGAFASQGIIGTWASVRDPGTAWVMAYHALGGEVYGPGGGWGFVRGGMGALTHAIARAARAAGAQVRCGCAVSEVLLDGGAVSGVRLEDGSMVRAPMVLSGADPKTTFLRLVPGGALDDEFVQGVRAWPTPGCVLKVNLALAELPDFVARPGAGIQHNGTIELAGTIDDLHSAYTDAVSAGWSSCPFMEVFVQSAVDPTLVDGDGHVVSVFAQYVNPGDSWEQRREKAVDAVMSTFGSYAPNVADVVIVCDPLGPPELEERFGLTGGNIFHGEILPEQSFGNRFDYRTPLRGLYLCGSGARPGGCVMGAAGRNAAKVVLRDLARG